MSGYTFWVDKKLDLMINFLREKTYDVEADGLIEDLRICHDQVRVLEERCHGGDETFRDRFNKLLIATSIMKKKTDDYRSLHYLDALEGVLLGVLRGKP